MADTEANQAHPSFSAAPQSVPTRGKIHGDLKGKTKGYLGLSKRAKVFATLAGGGILALIVLGITALPDPAETAALQKEKEEAARLADKAKRDGPKSTVPNSVVNAGDGVSRSADAEAALASARSTNGAGKPVVPGLGPGSDPLAAGATTNAGQQQTSNGTLSPEEQEAQQERRNRLQMLREARNADLRDGSSQQGQQAEGNPAGGRSVVPAIGGGQQGAGQPNPQGMVNGMQDDQNKQGRKEAFLGGMVGNAGAVPATYLPASVQKPRSPYQIEAGWLIPAMMDSQMNSDLPGTIRAHVSQNVMDSATGRFVLIPSGSRLVGHYDSQIAFGQQRVLVVWDLLKFPDGSELALMGMPAVDQVGAAGLTGEVDNHMWTVIKAATFMSVITAGAQLSQPQSRRSNGDNEGPSVNQTLAAQLGTQLGQVSGNMVNRYLNIQPTITTSQGTRFNILVKQNVVFDRPWSWR
jgi:type IV secretion system protein VirB10